MDDFVEKDKTGSQTTCCRVGQLRSCNMSLTELVLWNRLVTYLAALRCAISNWWIWDWWWGSHMQLLCSNLGLTSDWYARSLISGEATLRFRLRKLSCRDALAVMLYCKVTLVHLPGRRRTGLCHFILISVQSSELYLKNIPLHMTIYITRLHTRNRNINKILRRNIT